MIPPFTWVIITCYAIYSLYYCLAQLSTWYLYDFDSLFIKRKANPPGFELKFSRLKAVTLSAELTLLVKTLHEMVKFCEA